MENPGPRFRSTRIGIVGTVSALVLGCASVCAWAGPPPNALYLREAVGNLDVVGLSTASTYTAYFHVPVPYGDQVPILITVESPQLLSYRFVHLDPPNLLVAAEMKRASSTTIHWDAWVLVKENTYADLPASVQIPAVNDLPEEVRAWLVPTDCAQIGDPFVKAQADAVRGGTSDLMVLAENVRAYCYDLPWTFDHDPVSFDAYYAMKWGNSCTGHAHAGAALMRANGVPARSLHVMPVWYDGYFDMHWNIDYYVPGYGWVRMETSLGENPTSPEKEIVTFVCAPGDEFPVFYPVGIEGQWHTSEPAIGPGYPNWGGAHRAYAVKSLPTEPEAAERLFSLTKDVFSVYADAWGLSLAPGQAGALQRGRSYQGQALSAIQAGDLSGYETALNAAKGAYEEISLAPAEVIYSEDFESGVGGWAHGGTNDDWELGSPSSCGPQAAHSGASCWGTDLDSTYRNHEDAWLLSPPLDLRNLSGAALDFWLYGWAQDEGQMGMDDPLWMDATSDGVAYEPLCNQMAGVNDDPAIPAVGGWTHVFLDLAKYLGHESVQVRFRFQSDASVVQPGFYVDDVRVLGRRNSGCALSCSASATPASGQVPLSVAFSAQVQTSGCLEEPSFAWDFDGDGTTDSTEQNPSYTYAEPGTFTWTLHVTSGETVCTQTGAVQAGVAPPSVTDVRALSDPFRICVTGSNFQGGLKVYLAGQSSPWGSVRQKGTSELLLKAAKSLFPKDGTETTIRIVNPDGGEVTVSFNRKTGAWH